MKFNKLIAVICVLVISGISTQVLADRRPGTSEFTISVPYIFSDDFGGENGSSLSTRSSTGFGLGFGYHYSRQLTFSGDITWNDIKYDGTRVIIDPTPGIDNYSGKLSTWAMRFGGDYYFNTNKLSPFVNGNIGWSFVDTNIPDGPPGAICWWDPWWGQTICRGYQNTYREDHFMYGVGAGLRLEIGRNNFAKLGYYSQWLGYDTGAGSSSMDTIRLDFGFAF